MKAGEDKQHKNTSAGGPGAALSSQDEAAEQGYRGMEDLPRKKSSDPMSKFSPEARIDEFLRKPLDRESIRNGGPMDPEESKRLARQIITGKRGKWFNRWETFKDKLRRHLAFRLKLMRIAGTRRFIYESGPLILFSVFAIYVSWEMEDRLDQMKRKVVRVKTLREEETERENQYLQNALEGRAATEFEDKPIGSGASRDRNKMYSLDVENDEDEGALIASPFQEYNEREIDPDEMASLMKQYEDKSKKLIGGYARLGNPVTTNKGPELALKTRTGEPKPTKPKV